MPNNTMQRSLGSLSTYLSKAAFTQIQNRVRLKPVETHTFSSGTVLLRCASVSR